jgi:hypothetical protein
MDMIELGFHFMQDHHRPMPAPLSVTLLVRFTITDPAIAQMRDADA